MKFSSYLILFGIIFLLIGFYFVRQNNYKNNQLPLREMNNKVIINNSVFKVILATTSAQMTRGLSGRPNLPVDYGMLFIFAKPDRHNFWMYDMNFPLDILFILNNEVTGVYENLPPASPGDKNPPLYGGDVVSDMVFEINAGLAKKYNIKVGDNIKFETN